MDIHINAELTKYRIGCRTIASADEIEKLTGGTVEAAAGFSCCYDGGIFGIAPSEGEPDVAEYGPCEWYEPMAWAVRLPDGRLVTLVQAGAGPRYDQFTGPVTVHRIFPAGYVTT